MVRPWFHASILLAIRRDRESTAFHRRLIGTSITQAQPGAANPPSPGLWVNGSLRLAVIPAQYPSDLPPPKPVAAQSPGHLNHQLHEHNFWDTENKLLFTAVGASRTLDYFSTLNMRSRGRRNFLTNDIVDNRRFRCHRSWRCGCLHRRFLSLSPLSSSPAGALDLNYSRQPGYFRCDSQLLS